MVAVKNYSGHWVPKSFELVLLRNFYLLKATKAIYDGEEPTAVKGGNSFLEDRQGVGIELQDCIEDAKAHAKSICRATSGDFFGTKVAGAAHDGELETKTPFCNITLNWFSICPRIAKGTL